MLLFLLDFARCEKRLPEIEAFVIFLFGGLVLIGAALADALDRGASVGKSA